METMIVRAVGRARFHGGNSLNLEIVDGLFEQLRSIHKNKDLPANTRFWALEQMLRIRPVSGEGIGLTTDNDLLKLILNASGISTLADNASSSPITNIAFALHTADPTASGNMSSNEIAYTSYARVNVARNSGGITVTSNSASPSANISFPIGTGGSGTATYFSCGYPTGGAAKILFSGTVTPNIVCGNGITPILTTATTITLN